MAQRTLIRRATVITMDAQGDLSRGDVLVEGDAIAAIATHIDEPCTRTLAGMGFARAQAADRHAAIIVDQYVKTSTTSPARPLRTGMSKAARNPSPSRARKRTVWLRPSPSTIQPARSAGGPFSIEICS